MSTDDNLNGGAQPLDDQQRQMLAHLERNAGGPDAAGGFAAGGAAYADPGAAEVEGLMVAVLTPAFAILAPNWQVQPPEVQQLAQAYTPVMLKYFPDGIGDVGPELAAVLVTLTVLGGRLGTPRRVVVVQEESANGDGKAAA